MTSPNGANVSQASGASGTQVCRRRWWWRSSKAVIATVAVVLLVGVGIAIGDGASDGPAEPVAPNSVDIGFAQDMVFHHQQAVTMVQMIDGRVGNRVGALAQLIETNQLLEIGQLQGALDLWQEPRIPGGERMTWMRGDDADHAHTTDMGTKMPGMATQAELNTLQQLSGKQLETRFLQLMLRHHQGGLPMASYTARHAALEPIRNLAKRILYEQKVEIQRIATLLEQRNANR